MKTNPFQTDDNYPYPNQNTQVVDPQARDSDGNTVKTNGKVSLVLKAQKAKIRILDGS